MWMVIIRVSQVLVKIFESFHMPWYEGKSRKTDEELLKIIEMTSGLGCTKTASSLFTFSIRIIMLVLKVLQ